MPHSRILVLGSGGREHALAWRLARDPDVAEVLVAPGNDGMGRTFRRVQVVETDGADLARICRQERIDLAVIGPEAPLAAGVADALRAAQVPTYGPSAAAARLESSKWFAKEVMQAAGVPTARAERHERTEGAIEALQRFTPPWVLKADGLAAGKGVLVTRSRQEAEAFLRACLEGGKFGASGAAIVIEEYLEGEERSVMAVCSGRDFVVLPTARDYKRARDGDEGPNTGGMGAYAPASSDETLHPSAHEEIIAPILAEMERRGTPFQGTLYAGLMLTRQGPRVLEFNVRFGDPETQVVMPLLEGSFERLLASAAAGAVDRNAIRNAKGHAVTVALVDEGYPDHVRGGGLVANLDAAASRHGVEVFHAATRWDNGEWRVAGGRAAYVVAQDATREAARERAYAAIDDLRGDGWRCRRDIARDGSMAATSRPSA